LDLWRGRRARLRPGEDEQGEHGEHRLRFVCGTTARGRAADSLPGGGARGCGASGGGARGCGASGGGTSGCGASGCGASGGGGGTSSAGASGGGTVGGTVS